MAQIHILSTNLNDQAKELIKVNKILIFSLFLFANTCLADTVVILLDTSGSMLDEMWSTNDSKAEVAKQALVQTVNNLSEETNVGILTFQSWIYPISKLNKAQAIEQINNIKFSGATPLGAFTAYASEELLKFKNKNHYGSYKLLIITDGEAQDNGILNAIIPDVLQKGVTINAIGVNMSSRHTLATKVNAYRNANDPKSLNQAIKDSLAEVSDTFQDDFESISSIPNEVGTAIVTGLTNSSTNGDQSTSNEDQSQSLPASSSGISFGTIAAIFSIIALIVAIFVFVVCVLNS